jgi:DNA polymerase III subunit delta'
VSLCGHDAAWREWRAAMGSERMHHAWICAGLRGLGKGMFARAAAAELVAEPGVPQPDPANHPDIIVLEALPANDDEEKKRAEGKPFQTKRNISIDQIRRMQARLTTRPTLGARRAIIIDPADELEKGAVNALLKSLEEPPQGTFFLLVAHRPGRLLPTIRSRCRMLRFAPLTDAQVAEIVASAPADAVTRASLRPPKARPVPRSASSSRTSARFTRSCSACSTRATKALPCAGRWLRKSAQGLTVSGSPRPWTSRARPWRAPCDRPLGRSSGG